MPLLLIAHLNCGSKSSCGRRGSLVSSIGDAGQWGSCLAVARRMWVLHRVWDKVWSNLHRVWSIPQWGIFGGHQGLWWWVSITSSLFHCNGWWLRVVTSSSRNSWNPNQQRFYFQADVPRIKNRWKEIQKNLDCPAERELVFKNIVFHKMSASL